MPKPGNRGIRGIRHPLPAGTLIGRKINGGDGAPGYITFADLAQYIAGMSGILQAPLPPYNPTPQFVQISTDLSGAVHLLSGIPARVLDITLPAGTWDLSASVTFDPNGAAMTNFTDAIVAISLSPSLIPLAPNGGGYVESTQDMSITGTTTLATGVMRLVLTATTPVWLLAEATFT